jgi:hypothetical protein
LKYLGLTIIVVGFVSFDIMYQMIDESPIKYNLIPWVLIISILIIGVGIGLAFAGHAKIENILTEDRLLEILRSDEFNVKEFLHSILVKDQD